jgi:hypothetical protein
MAMYGGPSTDILSRRSCKICSALATASRNFGSRSTMTLAIRRSGATEFLQFLVLTRRSFEGLPRLVYRPTVSQLRRRAIAYDR